MSWPPYFGNCPPSRGFAQNLKFVQVLWIAFRASPAVLSMWLRKYFSHPSLVMYSFATPPLKLKRGQQIAGGLLITHHLDQSLWWANQKHWVAVTSYLLYSFLQVQNAAEPLPATASWATMLSQNQFPQLNRHMLNFLYPFVLCRITYWPPLEMLLHPFFIWPGWTSTHTGTSTFFMEWGLLVAKLTQEMLSSFGLRDPNLV